MVSWIVLLMVDIHSFLPPSATTVFLSRLSLDGEKDTAPLKILLISYILHYFVFVFIIFVTSSLLLVFALPRIGSWIDEGMEL